MTAAPLSAILDGVQSREERNQMADQPSIVVTGDSHEAVAYGLFLGIARHEKKNIHFAGGTPVVEADADWVLTTFRRCQKAAYGEKE
jgi:hypothetical protein